MPFPKTYRTNAGWGLSIGAILALFSNLRNEQRAVIALAIIGALGFLWSAWEHEWIRWNRKSIPRVALILGGCFLILCFVWPPPSRAHLRVYRYDIGPPQNGNPPYFNVYIRNDGEMDGEMKAGGNIYYISGAIPEPKKRGDFEDKAFEAMLEKEPWKDASVLQVPSKNESYSSPIFPNTDSDTAKKLQTGEIIALLTGRIVYTDKSGEHHTDYCLMVQKYQRPFIMCQRHNDAP